MKSIVGIAACLAVAIMVWLVPFFFALTPSVTLAQVEAAVAKQKWLHVKYDTVRALDDDGRPPGVYQGGGWNPWTRPRWKRKRSGYVA